MKYGTLKIKIHSQKTDYKIKLTTDEISKVWEKEFSKSKGKILVVCDDYVYNLYKKNFPVNNKNIFSITFPHGEESKTLNTVEKVYQKLSDIGADRETLIVALGGGVVGDLAGFVAATYLRGLSYIQIPTTLLSQIDSSIGGKVGVNFYAKNRVGGFYHPQAVYSDSYFWNTLDERQWINGLGEVIKYALLLDREYFYSLKENQVLVLKRNPKVMQKIIKGGLLFKSRIVEMDEKENDIRRILNLGHTLGHTIESAGEYSKYLHGEGVMFGLKAMLHISKNMKILKSSEYDLIYEMLNTYYSEKLPESIKTKDLLNYLKQDKKVKNNKNVWVLLKEIGKPVMADNVEQKHIEEAIESLR